MSWGFFVDLDLTLPTKEWERLKKTRTGDHAVSPGWWGLKERELESMFLRSDLDDLKLGKLLDWFANGSSIRQVSEQAGSTHVRLLTLLDRSGDPHIAKTIAALVEGARASGKGRVRLINDGTYSGEDGVLVRLEAGEIVRARVADSNPIAEKLGAELFEGASVAPAEVTDSAPAKAKAPSKTGAKPPAEPAKPTKATKPTKAAKPAAEPAKAVTPAKPTKAVTPAKSTPKPAKAPEPAIAAKPAKVAKSAKAIAEPAKAAAKPAAKPTKPAAKPAEPAKPAKPTKAAAKPAEPAKPAATTGKKPARPATKSRGG